MTGSIDLTLYLFRRLRQLGIKFLHGVPGDYNLSALDYLSQADLKWVGNCNELNGGENLSAINAHAGAFAERVPVVHIVGTAASNMRTVKDMIFHHTLGNYDYGAFARCYEAVSVGHLSLRDPKFAPAQIDNILLECWLKKGPVYIDLPMDMVSVKVDGSRLKTPLLLQYPSNQKGVEEEAVTNIITALSAAQRPCILIGMWALRQKATFDIERLTKVTMLPTFVTTLAQGGADEASPYYKGIYSGRGSQSKTKELFEQSDLVLHIGPHNTDVSTFIGSAKIAQDTSINIYQDRIELQGHEYPGLYLNSTIKALVDKLESSKINFRVWAEESRVKSAQITNGFNGDSEITHDWLWPHISDYLRQGDIVVAETGTASFGIFDTTLPKDCILINPSIWASIGYGVGGAQGAALAAKDEGRGRHTIVFEGDCSFQLTCQELSTMIRHDLKVLSYNDIARWNYADILGVFEGPTKKTRSYQVRKASELLGLLADDEFGNFPGVQLVEMFMPPLDVPRFLRKLSEKIKGT
ncbi:hypothetical protein H2200_002900 [Cladophialophora chaetospira]|uniref:Pyruvate decarboxylase n=1 Tax=Cladophialophora chaetospira TaxID=386627 RepID=A0AA38XGF0_9EURO|nr:hypothetical protein H2200_002900 [Cladophialophora chaetospira]